MRCVKTAHALFFWTCYFIKFPRCDCLILITFVCYTTYFQLLSTTYALMYPVNADNSMRFRWVWKVYFHLIFYQSKFTNYPTFCTKKTFANIHISMYTKFMCVCYMFPVKILALRTWVATFSIHQPKCFYRAF